MNRSRLLVKNFLVYGFGGVISKAIPLIMVPIITRMMPSSFYYGMSDLSATIVSLFSALALMGMYDAMYRMFFEKDDEKYKKDICSSALFFTLISSTAISLILVALQVPISSLFFSDSSYGNLVMLCAMSVLIGSTNSIVSAPTRMQNKGKIYLITNALSPTIAYAIAIPLLLAGHYLIALPVSMLISAFSVEIIFYILNRKWFSFKQINWKYIKSMLMIALPLLPNFIIYWIFNSSDRVMISNLIGTDASGVYAVAGKIGQLSQLIYLAFAGGWQFFAFSIMKDKDNVGVISKVFEILAALSFVTTILGTSICKIGVEILFKEDYWPSYICIPYLYLAPLLLMLFQIGSNQFLVIKKTWPNLLILGGGAIVNIVLNFVLIPVIGIEGASIATFVGYFISILVCVIVLLRLNLLEIHWRFLSNVILFGALFAIMRINAFTTYYINVPLALLFLAYNIIIYKKDICSFVAKLLNRNYISQHSEQSQGESDNVTTQQTVTNLNDSAIQEEGVKNRINITGIQVLRAFAILIIFLSHCSLLTNAIGNNAFNYLGAFGVTIFIMISGYLAINSDFSKINSFKSYLKYVVKKIMKFYPLHIITLLIVLPLCISTFKENVTSSVFQTVANVFLIHAFIPSSNYYFAFNAVSWYLSLNLFFILIAPFINKLFVNAKLSVSIVTTVLFFAIEITLFFVFQNFERAHWILYICPFTRTLDYLIGANMFIIGKEINNKTNMTKKCLFCSFIVAGLACMVAQVLVSWNYDSPMFLAAVWVVPSIMLLLSSVLDIQGFILKELLENKTFITLGNISLYVFLTHQVIIRYLEVIFRRANLIIEFSYLAAFIITLFVAYNIYDYLRRIKTIQHKDMKQT